MKFKYYFLLIMILPLTGCKEKAHQHQTDHNRSNIHMNKSSFEALAGRFEDPSRNTWQKPAEVIAMLGDIKGRTIMDIGAGTGYFSFRLAEKGATVIAADVDERFLNYIKDKTRETGSKSVITRLVPYDDPGLGNNEVDAVIIVDTYHHIENRVSYFQKVLQGLKPGGRLMVVDFKKESTPHGPPADHRLSSETVKTELEKAGFINIKNDSITLPYQYIIIAQKTGA